jgi:hypothetical protein|uniref:Uncharacterized protein n=1 Tax=Zea mays TaxID=4577 RepID=A0A804LSK9_MAIZE
MNGASNKRASSAVVALLHDGFAVVACELVWCVGVGLTAPRHWAPGGEGARQEEGHTGPPAGGVAEADAPSSSSAAGDGEAAARGGPVSARLDARRPAKVGRGDGFPENVVGQPQRVALRVRGGTRRAGGRRRGERVARGVRARELRLVASQRALGAGDPQQLGGLLPPEPLVLGLPGSGCGVDHHGMVIIRRCSDRGSSQRGGLGSVGDEEDGAADGAGDVRREPGVDAVGVERVGAPGQQPERVAVVELAEADGALERALVRPDVGVGHGREGVEHGPVEAAHPPAGRRRVAVVAEPQTQLPRMVVVVGPAQRGPRASAEVDGEEAEQEEGRDQHDHDNRHGRVEILGVEVVGLRVHGGAGESNRGEEQETAAAAAIDRAHGCGGGVIRDSVGRKPRLLFSGGSINGLERATDRPDLAPLAGRDDGRETDKKKAAPERGKMERELLLTSSTNGA